MFHSIALRISLLVLILLPALSRSTVAQAATEVYQDPVASVITYATISVQSVASGSLTGKVVNDTGTADQPEGVGGVRVVLRSVNDPNGHSAQHQISDPAGYFYFAGLRLDKYLIRVDPISLPARFRVRDDAGRTVDVTQRVPTKIDLPISAERAITGTVFIDKDGNGEFSAGKDVPVQGAMITMGGAFAVSKADGTYSFRDLPAGRVAILVEWPGRDLRTHVLLHLANGPVKNRVVNIAREL